MGMEYRPMHTLGECSTIEPHVRGSRHPASVLGQGPCSAGPECPKSSKLSKLPIVIFSCKVTPSLQASLPVKLENLLKSCAFLVFYSSNVTLELIWEVGRLSLQDHRLVFLEIEVKLLRGSQWPDMGKYWLPLSEISTGFPIISKPKKRLDR